MKIILYTLLAVMALFSGFFAISGSVTEKQNTPTDEKSKLGDIFAIGKNSDNKAMVHSRLIALAVYIISVASMVTIHLIKG